MFKRFFWLITGAGFGFGMSFWLTRMMREAVERYMPKRVSVEMGRVVRGFGADVRAAVSEGRTEMAESEARLRADVETRRLTRQRQPTG